MGCEIWKRKRQANKLKKTLNVLALAAIVLAPTLASAEKLTRHTDSEGWEEWYWTKTVTCTRGQAHTFWIKGLTENTAITGLEVYYTYKYKEDGETYEDQYYASESCEVENSSGGFDKYVLLTEEDWEYIPGSGNVNFIVYVDGWGYDEDLTTADMSFTFGHSAGNGDYPGEEEAEPEPLRVYSLTPSAVADVSNETACATQTYRFVRYTDGSGDDTDACCISLPLVAGVEYWMGIVGSGCFAETFSWTQTPKRNLLETDVLLESVTNVWTSCSGAYRLRVPYSGDYIFRITNAVDAATVGFRSVFEDHLAVNFPEGMSSPICPGFPVDWHLEAVDGSVKSVTGLPRGLSVALGSNGNATISGVAEATGSFEVAVTVTNGSAERVLTKTVVVNEVPCKGTFTGFASVAPDGSAFAVPAPIAVSVDAKGKLSGAITVNGKKLALSASTCATVDVANRCVAYDVPVGDKTYRFDFNAGTLSVAGEGTGMSWAHRTCESGSGYKEMVAAYVGNYQFALETAMGDPGESEEDERGTSVFTLAVDKTGRVTLKGYLPDGTSVGGAGKLAGDEANSVALIVTGSAFGSGGCAVNVVFALNPEDWSADPPAAWFDIWAVRAARRTTAREYKFSGTLPWYDENLCVTKYDVTEVLPAGFTPETTRLVLTCGEGCYAYDLAVDGKGNLKGLGNSTDKSAPKLTWDVKTGLLTGSGCVGTRKASICGLVTVAEGTDGRGGGTAVFPDGSWQDVTVTFEKTAEVVETLDDGRWGGETADNPVYVGSDYACEVGVTVDGMSVALTVNGLPKGLVYDQGQGCIRGTAAKAGSYAVKYAYRIGSKTITRTKTLVIASLPSGLGGSSYEGFADVSVDDLGNVVRCPFAATVSAEGKLSGSVTLGGKKLPFAATGYDSLDATEGRLSYCSVPLDASQLDKALTAGIFNLDVTSDEVTVWPESGRIVPQSVRALRNRKSDKSYLSRIAPFVRTYVMAVHMVDANDRDGMSVLSLAVDKTGCVKAAGTLMDGTTFSASGLTAVDAAGTVLRMVVPVVSKALDDGGLGLALTLYWGGSDNTPIDGLESDLQGSTFSLKTGTYAAIATELMFCEPYAPGCWMSEEADPQTTFMALEADELQAFYEVSVDSRGAAAGIGKTLNGAELKLKFNAKTGIFSGSASGKNKVGEIHQGSYKIFGALNRADSSWGSTGAGTVVWGDGTFETLTVSWRQLAVEENLNVDVWQDPENPIRMGSKVSLDPTVTVDGSSIPLTFMGLPPGLKYSAASGISGVPTKAGSYAVKISYTLGSKKIVRTETMVIADFPSGVIGTYNGVARLFIPSAGVSIPCPLTATLDNKGTLKGTITAMGKKASFSAVGYVSCDSENGNVEFEDVAFNLKAIDPALEDVHHSLTIGPLLGMSGYYGADDGGAFVQIEDISAYRDATRDASRSQEVAPFVGNWVLAHELTNFNDTDVPIVASVSVDAKGSVKVSGTFYDGTAFSAKGVLVVHPAGSYALGVLAEVALPMTAKSLNDGGWCLYLSWLTDDEDSSRVSEFSTLIRGACFSLKSGTGRSLNESREIFSSAYSAGCWFDETLVPVATDLVLALQDDASVETACVPLTTDKGGTVNGCSTTVDYRDWFASDYIVNGDWGGDYGEVSGSKSLGGLKLNVDNKTGLLSGTISASASNKKLCCGMSVGRSGKVYGVLSSAVIGDGVRGLAMVVWSDDLSIDLIEIGSRSKPVSEDFGGLEGANADTPLEVGTNYLFPLSILVGEEEMSSNLKVLGLPPGLTYEPEPNFGQTPRIVGTPSRAGTYQITISYAIGSQRATRIFTVVVR